MRVQCCRGEKVGPVFSLYFCRESDLVMAMESLCSVRVLGTGTNNHGFCGGGMAKLWGISLVCGMMYVEKGLIFVVLLLVFAYLVGFWIISRFRVAFIVILEMPPSLQHTRRLLP